MIFRFKQRDLESEAVTVAFIMSWREGGDAEGADAALGRLAGFRRELYLSLGLRRDVLFEACDAALCKPGRGLVVAEVCPEPEGRRGAGAGSRGRERAAAPVARPRRAPTALPAPAAACWRVRAC